MKKIFVFAVVIISTIVLTLSIGINFAQAQEKMMDQGQMKMERGEDDDGQGADDDGQGQNDEGRQ